MSAPVVPFKGADIVITFPTGFKLDVKSMEQNLQQKQETYFVVGGGGRPKSNTVASSESWAFAGIGLNDGSSCPVPSGIMSTVSSGTETPGSITAMDGLSATVTFRTGEVWNMTVNVSDLKVSIISDANVAMSGTLVVTGWAKRNPT